MSERQNVPAGIDPPSMARADDSLAVRLETVNARTVREVGGVARSPGGARLENHHRTGRQPN